MSLPPNNPNQDPKGNGEASGLAIALLTVTLVGAAFWIIAWWILSYFGA
jgi:hypothetical protein